MRQVSVTDRDLPRFFLDAMWAALGGSEPLPALEIEGNGSLPSTFATSDFAAASVGVAALCMAKLVEQHASPHVAHVTYAPRVTVDRRLASFWFDKTFIEQGWTAPPVWDVVAGDYPTVDGWIRLHTNAPHHRDAALAVLGVPADKSAVRAAVSRWQAGELEEAIVARGGCAAAMRSLAAWAGHPQGNAIAAEPLIWHQATDTTDLAMRRPFDAARPLAGVRVLDLTRIVAGPVATRFLAGFGAEVLRIDPQDWNEPSRAPEMTPGKTCARLDLRDPRDHACMLRLLADADILVHGYRSSALEGLGLGAEVRRRVRPGLVDVSLNAYGWTGPWVDRRGYDSLVQMSTGIAHEGMRRLGADRPVPLPVQALDHAAGYLMAAAAIQGLTTRWATGVGAISRVSLARMAALLTSAPQPENPVPLSAQSAADFDPQIELTAWGPASRLRAPVNVEGAPMRWDRPAAELGSSPAAWAV
jgi:crotonobetainyl-CoA:carnitine CoA-transferase CaiB-like acyl-CoA transferase